MISTRALSPRVGPRTLVERLDWSVNAGDCWCIIGRNGAGKTTLLRTLSGLREPDAGVVTISGRPLAGWPPEQLARQRAYLPQECSDAFSYRVPETVLAARHPYQAGRYWEDSDDHVIAMAALAQRDVRSLSGGERQRVAIAAMLAQDTPLLLLDEPANALDLAHQVSLMRLIARLCREQGKAAVSIGHGLASQ
ncbi:MAG: ABC transporter ATP-binding protein [Herminiimonas sp.]|nr:ABC transporter ATP-binding protein [Herminiimonas sp.]